MNPVEINYLAVLLGAVANMVIGALWYSPLMFANQWLALIGKKKEDIKGAGPAYAKVAVSALLMSYVVAHFVDLVDAVTLSEGLQLGFWAWLGFVATTTFADVIFAGKPWKLWAINNGYNLVSLLVMATILTWMN
jgi:hypothetical protein